MKRKISLFVSVLLVLTLVFSFSGCGSSGSDSSATSTGATASQTDSAAASSSAEKLEPITFSIFFADPNPCWNDMKDDRGKVITEKTGVTLQTEFAVGDVQQKISLIAASGEYPDLIQSKFTNVMVDAEALVDLTPLIEEHAPNIKKVYGDYLNRQRWSYDDKSIYEIATVDTVNNMPFDTTSGFELQYSVLKELGYPKIKTVKDFENAIKAYKDKHPKIDGKETIGLSLLADDWRWMITVTNPAFIATGAPDDGEWYIDPKTYEAKKHYFRPEEKEYFRWLNHMNNIGLLDKESFTQKYDQYKAKIASGTILALIDAEWEYGDGENALRKDGKGERAYAHFPVVLDENMKNTTNYLSGFSGGNGTSITTKCKDPVRAIKFLDYLSSDEGQVLINWGIEGKHYKVENGKRVIPQEIQDRNTNDNTAFKKETGLGSYFLSVRYGDGMKDPTGNYYNTSFPEQIVAAYPQEEKEILSKYNATTWMDLFPKPSEFPQRPYGAAWMISVPSDSDLNVFNRKCEDIVKKRIPEAILSTPEKFDSIYEGMLKEITAAGADKANAEYSEYVKKKIKLWEEK